MSTIHTFSSSLPVKPTPKAWRPCAQPFIIQTTTKKGMEAVCEKGLARNIGISNFNAQSVMDLMK